MKEVVVTGKSSIRKWKLWRTSSGSRSGTQNYGNASETSSMADGFNAAVATVVQAPLRDFKVAMEEWAAIRIQTAFRGFLVRRALRALKGVVGHWYEADRKVQGLSGLFAQNVLHPLLCKELIPTYINVLVC